MSIKERQQTEERGWYVEPMFTGDPLIPRELLQELEDHPEAPGRSSWGTRNILASYILSLRPKTVLEIGSHIGSGAVVMGSALKRNNFGTLYCLEPQDHYFGILSDFIARAGLEDYVQPLKMMSTDPELTTILPRKVDIVYLDANHSYSHVYADLELCDKLIDTDGIVFLDDTGHERSPAMDSERRGGVRQAVVDFARHRPDLAREPCVEGADLEEGRRLRERLDVVDQPLQLGRAAEPVVDVAHVDEGRRGGQPEALGKQVGTHSISGSGRACS